MIPQFKMNITTKLILGFIAVLGMTAASAVITYSNLNTLESDFGFLINHDLEVLQNAQQLQKYVVDAETGQRGFIITGQEEFLEPYYSGIENFDKLIEVEKELVSDNPAAVATLEGIQVAHMKWREVAGQPEIDARKMLQAQYDAGDLTALSQIPNILLGGVIENAQCGKCILDELRVDFDAFIAEETSLKDQRFADVSTVAPSTINMVFLITAICSAIGMAIAIYLSRSISKPIQKAAEVAESISRGDLTVHLDASKSRDETGTLLNAQLKMKNNLVELISEVKSGTNSVIENAKTISSSTDQMNSSVEQIASTIGEITKGSQSQATGLANTGANVTKLSKAMKELAEKATQSATLTNEVGDIAETGGKAATEAGNKMNEIITITNETADKIRGLAEKTANITSVLDVISGIAQQTNLLALNAAVEAARAGDAGRGFAVVAEEVRRLAEGSAKSSQEVTIQLEEIKNDAASTVESIENGAKEILESKEVVDGALSSLDEIADKVKKISTDISTLAKSANEQVTNVDAVDKSTVEMSATAEENAAATEEASAAIEEQTAGTQEIASSAQTMTEMAEQLSNTIDKFKIDNSSDETPSTPKHKTKDSKSKSEKPKVTEANEVVSF